MDASKGDKTDHLIPLPAFNRIELRSGGILNYTEDSLQHTIIVNSSDEVMEAMEVYVDDSTLIFGLKEGYTITNYDQITITVNSKLVKDYVIKGEGEININRTTNTNLDRSELIISGTGMINVNQMDASTMFSLISGDGDIHLQNLTANVNYGIISGSGDLALYGFARRSELQVDGVGNIYAYPLDTYHTKCNAIGSASMRVKADSTLDISISGYGNIFYKGFPTITTDISGDGSVIDDN